MSQTQDTVTENQQYNEKVIRTAEFLNEQRKSPKNKQHKLGLLLLFFWVIDISGIYKKVFNL